MKKDKKRNPYDEKFWYENTLRFSKKGEVKKKEQEENVVAIKNIKQKVNKRKMDKKKKNMILRIKEKMRRRKKKKKSKKTVFIKQKQKLEKQKA